MANLPPRPETPPKLREERRHADDRDRERRPAQPMAPSRLSRPLSERERSYAPSRRPDTYIPSVHDSRRESDRRDHSRERERDRYRDVDRDRDRDRRVGRDRERDYDRSPRKWELPDRDRRPYDRNRGTYRKPLSPIRRSGSGPSRRNSRSPPRRRLPPRSPSPSYRSRPRSRTRTRSPRRSPLPSKGVRLGKHSIGTSPRSRSPYRRSRSRGRSMSVDKRPTTSIIPHSSGQQPSDTPVPALVTEIKKEEEVEIRIPEEDSMLKLQKPEQAVPQDLKSSLELPEPSISEETKPPIQGSSLPEQSPRPAEQTQLNPKLEEVNTKKNEVAIPASPAAKRSLKVETAEDIVSNKMDVVDSPKHTPTLSNLRTRSPSPQAPRSSNDHQRPAVTNAPPRSWSGRSPPRGPRNFPRPINLQNQPPYAIGRRDSRRSYPNPGQPTHPISTSKVEPDVKLPMIPKYDRSKMPTELAALEGELAKLRTLRLTHAHQDLTQVKGLQRALHELDMASIDLHAAEGRRRVADAQLEKAKTGSLGIDAPDIVDI